MIIEKEIKQKQNFEERWKMVPGTNRRKSRKMSGLTKKNILENLEGEIKELGNMEGVKLNKHILNITDPVLKKIEFIEQNAKNYELHDVQKLCALAVGKRILNLEVYKKKQALIEKKQRKEEIEEFLRERKIKKYDYPNLVRAKIQQNSFIVQPYSSGKGFIGSTLYYVNYTAALGECKYLQVIKEVNKICFNKFDLKQDKYEKIPKLLMAILVILLVLTMFLTLSASQTYIYSVITVFTILILSSLYLSISNYLTQPNLNTQNNLILAKIRLFFGHLNKQSQKNKKRFSWILPNDFMYLQVHFHQDIFAD